MRVAPAMPKAEKKTERCNNASSARFQKDDLMSPFAQGSFRYCALGEYYTGNRKGEKAVCKWFKTGKVTDRHFFNKDIQAIEKAVELVTYWNDKKFIQQTIRVNVPEVWTSKNWGTVLVEPFIENYKKFNSNTGWADSSSEWNKAMQALSHFTYHVSCRQYLLCDVQGGIYSNGVVLTDPVILSQTGEFGETDLGTKGISSFFKHHRCNKYCCSHWRKPKNCKQYFNRRRGTSMGVQSTITSALSQSTSQESNQSTGKLTKYPPPPFVYF